MEAGDCHLPTRWRTRSPERGSRMRRCLPIPNIVDYARRVTRSRCAEKRLRARLLGASTRHVKFLLAVATLPELRSKASGVVDGVGVGTAASRAGDGNIIHRNGHLLRAVFVIAEHAFTSEHGDPVANRLECGAILKRPTAVRAVVAGVEVLVSRDGHRLNVTPCGRGVAQGPHPAVGIIEACVAGRSGEIIEVASLRQQVAEIDRVDVSAPRRPS